MVLNPNSNFFRYFNDPSGRMPAGTSGAPAPAASAPGAPAPSSSAPAPGSAGGLGTGNTAAR